MDFDNVLSIASQNKGGSHGQKRYSLQAGPPKKDPKSKGVNPAAIQALLKKQNMDHKKKEIENKKQKEELLAKRVELKSDRKARAMASRTKDNFRGYNGIPIVDVPKKRRTKQEMLEEARQINTEQFRNDVNDLEDDEDNIEYEQTDSESDEEPQRNTFSMKPSSGSMKPSMKQSAAPKMNFADLLKLAEKKQHEPVDLKPKVMKKDERLRTAEEIRELELERKAKKLEKDVKGERSHSSSSSSKATFEKIQFIDSSRKVCGYSWKSAFNFNNCKESIIKKRRSTKSGTIATAKSNVTKPGMSSTSKPTQPQVRPGGPPQIKSGVRPGISEVRPQGAGQSRPHNGAPTPGRSVKGGPGTPRCTVVSETISSKNMNWHKLMRLTLFHHPVPMLPPITSAYKRQYEEEEEEKFLAMIDPGENLAIHISKMRFLNFALIHVLFLRYKEESDYALRFMESSWKDMQKEEARR
uniref:SPT2 chromatin protein domain containing 1 n=1 Tax=Neogobius melanostomus TaxID=47308 RepID=A0A8C6UR32_9GOBI